MELEEKRKEILDFFKRFIEDFIMKDLEILNSIKPDNETGLGGCTIPTAMTIISASELLGFLLNEKGVTGKSKDNISHFFNYDKTSLFPTTYNSDIIDVIFNYRHGMMHHFFPKFKGQFAGICKDEGNSNLFIIHTINGQPEESLNVSVLVKDFIEAIKKLRAFFESTSDESIFDTILKGLKDIDYYIQVSSTTTQTTVNPGTPKNK
jgi:hypothetical protein